MPNGGSSPSGWPASTANSSKSATVSTQKPLPAKYCNPDNPRETWAGRGRIPRWMEPALKAGKKKEDFLIEKPLRTKERAR